jgi:hypothetical protein
MQRGPTPKEPGIIPPYVLQIENGTDDAPRIGAALTVLPR